MKNFKTLILFSFCCMLLFSCAKAIRTDLYFGMNIPGGGQVSQQQWKMFTDSVITPYFPEGYTEWDATGKWRDTGTKQTITEPTKVVTFIGRPTKARTLRLDSVALKYIHLFHQQSVLKVNSPAQLKFINNN
eukprot:gene11853-13816_t